MLFRTLRQAGPEEPRPSNCHLLTIVRTLPYVRCGREPVVPLVADYEEPVNGKEEKSRRKEGQDEGQEKASKEKTNKARRPKKEVGESFLDIAYGYYENLTRSASSACRQLAFAGIALI